MLKSRVARFAAELEDSVGNKKQRWTRREGIIFVVEGGAPRRKSESRVVHKGYGEASPLPGYSPDTLEECEECLQGISLFDESWLNIDSIEELVSSMPALPAARFAVETALLDLLATELGRSVGSLFGQYATSARRCALLDSKAPMESAAATLERGLKCAKLKVGGEWAEELATIRKLRSEFPELELRLDANGSWSLPEAKKHLALLQGLGIAFVEQPVASGVMAGLAGSKVPIGADESLQSQEGRKALEEWVEDPAMRVLVLKPTVLGGFRECLRLQTWARNNHTTAIASHCFEGPVGTAAVAELALAMDSSMASGVDEHAVLASMSHVRVPQLGPRYLQPHFGGLGVELEI